MKRAVVFIASFALLLTIVACKKGAGAKCNSNKECKADLVCSFETGECSTVEQVNAQCAARPACKQNGDCKVAPSGPEIVGGCVALSAEDCKQADCAKNGCLFHPETHNCY